MRRFIYDEEPKVQMDPVVREFLDANCETALELCLIVSHDHDLFR